MNVHESLLTELTHLLPAAASPPATGSELLETDCPPVGHELVATIRQWRPEGELRAAASVWSKYLFRLLLPPLVVARCLHPVRLVPAGALHLDGGLPQQWAALRFEEGAEDPDVYLAPWVNAIAGSSGVRPRVLWSNIGNQLEALLGRLPQQTTATESTVREYRLRWLETRELEKRSNPLYRPVRYLGNRRLRRVCCLRYRLEDLGYCTTCPLPSADSQG